MIWTEGAILSVTSVKYLKCKMFLIDLPKVCDGTASN